MSKKWRIFIIVLYLSYSNSSYELSVNSEGKATLVFLKFSKKLFHDFNIHKVKKKIKTSRKKGFKKFKKVFENRPFSFVYSVKSTLCPKHIKIIWFRIHDNPLLVVCKRKRRRYFNRKSCFIITRRTNAYFKVTWQFW